MCKICPLKTNEVARNGRRLNRDIACQCISTCAYGDVGSPEIDL